MPGTLEEKLAPWSQPILDSIEVLVNSGRVVVQREIQRLVDHDLLVFEALAYLRGRSLPNQFLLVDEAQNLSPHEIKTILTRAGEGTKVVLTGDPSQIDVPTLTEKTNGLTIAMKAFAGHPLAGSVELVECERSELAAAAAELL